MGKGTDTREMATTYRVFVRNWWKREAGQLVPDPRARKTTIETGLSFEAARAFCRAYNASHEPGPLSRKAEFTEE